MIAAAALLFAAATTPLAPVDETALQKLISSHKGNVVVVNFWATWCGPCRDEMPALVAFEKKHAARKTKLLLVSADELSDEPKARAFLQKVGARFPAWIKRSADDDRFINAVDAKWSGSLPATFVYDRAGKRVRSFLGEVEIKDLEAAVRNL